MSNERKVAQEMAVVIERIVSAERSDADAFIKLQNKRLRQLQEIQRRKDEGKTIQRGKIVLELRASGIIDESGNLAKPYSKGK